MYEAIKKIKMIKILENINHYYTDKIKIYGATPKGLIGIVRRVNL